MNFHKTVLFILGNHIQVCYVFQHSRIWNSLTLCIFEVADLLLQFYVAVSSYGWALQRGSERLWHITGTPSTSFATGWSTKSCNGEKESLRIGKYIRMEMSVVRTRFLCSTCLLFQSCKLYKCVASVSLLIYLFASIMEDLCWIKWCFKSCSVPVLTMSLIYDVA